MIQNNKNIYLSTKEELIRTIVPKSTRTYRAISNEQLIELTLNSIEGAGFTLDRESYSSARNGNVANGKFTIKNVADKEMQLQIGFQNSYNRSLSLKFAIGTRIFICQNGNVSGDYGAFKKKHMGEIQTFTPMHITEYIKQAGEAFEKMQRERERMKEIQISKRIQSELLGRMFIEENLLQSTQMNIIYDELKHPTHDYDCPNSMWEFYQFTVFSMKELHPSLWMGAHIKAHEFFVNNSNIERKTYDVEYAEIENLNFPHPQLEMFS